MTQDGVSDTRLLTRDNQSQWLSNSVEDLLMRCRHVECQEEEDFDNSNGDGTVRRRQTIFQHIHDVINLQTAMMKNNADALTVPLVRSQGCSGSQSPALDTDATQKTPNEKR